jgi:hypothetical protein
MRFMLKFTIPVERGNRAVKDGTIGPAIEQLLKATNAEAAYFTMIDGQRGGIVFFEETDVSRLTGYNEPMMAALDAAIDIVPVQSHEELNRGLTG